MTNPNPIPIIEFETAGAFEIWLEAHQDHSEGFWLKIFKKNANRKSISYAEALDVALCYGWIDSQKKALDEQAYLQKFSPRRAKSIWSKVNIGHTERLIREGRMRPAGLKAIEKAKEDGSWEKAYDPSSKMTIPADFLKALSNNKQAEAFFMSLNKANLFAIGFRLQTAKKQETREKRMKEMLEMLAKGEKFY